MYIRKYRIKPVNIPRLGLLIAYVLFVFSTLISCNQKQSTFKVATGGAGSSYFHTGKAIVSTLNSDKYLGIKFSEENNSALTGAINYQKLINHEVDFALIQNDIAVDNLIGSSEIRTVLPLYPAILFIIHKNSIAASTLKELVFHRKIAVGPSTSASALLTRRLLTDFGIDSTEYELSYTDYSKRTISDSVPICFSLTGYTNPEISEMLRNKNGVLFGLDGFELANRGSSVDGFCVHYPRAKPYIIPKNTFGVHPQKPILTIATDVILATRNDVNTDAIYKTTKDIIEKKQTLSAEEPLLSSLSENFDTKSLSFPIHDGARMYFDRNLPSIFERYADVVGVSVTVLATLMGAISVLTQWLKRRRKNRIDKYYLELIAIDNDSKNYRTEEQFAVAITTISDLKEHAYRQLADEKLSADESFRIFINLINETLTHIQKRHFEWQQNVQTTL